MSASTEHAATLEADQDIPDNVEPEHHSDGYYIKVALILAVLTAVETSTYWIDFGPLFLPTLFIMMFLKFFMVVMIFMHLRDEKPIYRFLFYTGLALALVVYLGALATFHFFE
jgi:cytochrome c oxidase subunit 4